MPPVSLTIKDSHATKLDPIFNTGSADTLAGLLNEIKLILIATSLETLKEEQTKGFDTKPIVVIDNRPSKPLFSVSPLGKIEFITSQVEGLEVVLATYREIARRSKVVTRTYLSGNVVIHNGKKVASDWLSLKTWAETATIKPNDEVMFVNIMPYARKLERLGITAQRSVARWRKSRDKRKRSGPQVLAENGVYFLSHRAVARKYKRNVKLSFGIVLGTNIPVERPNNFRKNYIGQRGAFGRITNNGPYLYPFIKIKFSEGGTI